MPRFDDTEKTIIERKLRAQSKLHFIKKVMGFTFARQGELKLFTFFLLNSVCSTSNECLDTVSMLSNRLSAALELRYPYSFNRFRLPVRPR